MRYILPLFVVSLFTNSCVYATTDVDNVCSSKEIKFPGVPVAVSVLAGERKATVISNSDMSETIGKISDIATVSLTSVNLNIDSQSDLSFLHHVKVTIHSTNDASNELLLSDVDFVGLNLPVSVDKNKLLDLLSKGPVTMKFIGTGNIPTEATNANTSFCVGVSAYTSKSIGDI